VFQLDCVGVYQQVVHFADCPGVQRGNAALHVGQLSVQASAVTCGQLVEHVLVLSGHVMSIPQ